MNNFATLLVAGAVALALVGCEAHDAPSGAGEPSFNQSGEPTTGGTTDGGTTDGGTTDAGTDGGALEAALDVRVLSDINRIETGGSDVATITALVTDEANNAVPAQDVSFRSTGGVLQNVTPVTDENGEAKATLKLAQDFRKQDIVVTVEAESFSGEVLIRADGSDLEIVGPVSLIEGADAELDLFLTAGNGEPIANETVRFESSAGNALNPAEAVTDTDGHVSTVVSSTAGNDTINVFALGDTVTASHAFTVSTDSLAFDGVDASSELAVGSQRDVTVTWTSQGQPVAGRQLSFSTTAGQIVGASTVTTNASGEATITLSSNSAGKAVLTVEDAVDGEPSAPSEEFEFVATAPSSVLIDATSTRIPALGTSKVKALVRDVNGNPVKGRRIVFSSPDLKGGQLNPAFATSGSDGEASVTFTAGANATTLDEIVLRAQVEGTTIADEMALSVVERVLNVTIGTANHVRFEDEHSVQYWMDFAVQVADGSGAPLEGADVSVSVKPLSYRKGLMVPVDDKGVEFDGIDEDWTHDGWAVWSGSTTCASEDANGNRVLDTGEDFNGNGVLDPQDPASLVATLEEGKATLIGNQMSTDATGSGQFRLLYPASNSLWSTIEITARARDLGAEAEDSFTTVLYLPATEFNQAEFTPSNHISPYGTSSDCSSTD